MSAVVSEEASERLAVLDGILADPPVVHPMEAGPDPRMGVWSTEPSCYRLLAERCGPGTRTLETGSGLSTVLFAALGAEHICCTAGQEEADRVLDHCRSHGFRVDRLRFEVGASHHTLPRLEAEGVEVDLVLVDGSHAFPLPVVDWLYAGSMLRAGGLLVVDDVELPAVQVLVRFVDADPRWTSVGGTRKWRAWERERGGTLSEDWTEQPFYRAPWSRAAHPLRWARGRLRAGRRRSP